jgi:tetratricopeptide (TPR) repeat protein
MATLDVQTALHCAQEAVRREPSHRLACARLVKLYDLMGDYSAAVPIADQLVKVVRHPAPVLVHKAGLLARMGRFHEAIKTYNRALAADPGAVDVYRCRAHVYRKLGEHAKAVADYTKLIEWEGRETAYVWDLYQRASPLWMLGRNAEAVEDYRRVRALRARPSYADARRFLILRDLKRVDEAEVVLADALREVDDPWLERILRCLGSEVEPGELVADAVEGGNIEQLCEACYYAGEACLLADRLADAHNFFDQCVATGLEFDLDAIDLTPMNEYDLARWRLQTSFAEPTHNPPHEKN